MDVKENLAKNIIKYRKALNLTQIELAEKLNYSDKAVSKWECGEAVPDLNTLKSLSDIFGVTIDTLISEPKQEKITVYKNLSKKRMLICLIAAFSVWLVATAAFAFINMIIPSIQRTWIFFIYAVPITLFILLVLTSVWGKSTFNLICSSFLLWTIIASIFLSFICFAETLPTYLWMIFLIGVPFQVLLVFFFLYKKVK